VNLEEAGLLCQDSFETAEIAVNTMLQRGAANVLVTDGGRIAAHGSPEGVITAEPPQVLVTRVTGAGDTFMAAHIAAEARGEAREKALVTALKAAADYVSGDVRS
jgi:pseudouridine kinase